jgi:hypothetical protein
MEGRHFPGKLKKLRSVGGDSPGPSSIIIPSEITQDEHRINTG